MKGIGVGQRPGRVAGIIINLHDQKSAVCARSLEKCKDEERKKKKKVEKEDKKEVGRKRRRWT